MRGYVAKGIAMFGVLIAALSMFSVRTFAADTLLQPGDVFPRTEMTTPVTVEEADYLGIKADAPFTIQDIKADVVMVEILNVYCSSCQIQAPFLNDLYNRLQNDAETRDTVKIIGFAAGNGPEEVKAFKDAFDIRYPVIPDPNFTMHAAIGRSRTPFLIFVRMKGGKSPAEVDWTHLGVYRDMESAYKALKKLKRETSGSAIITEKTQTGPDASESDSMSEKVARAVTQAIGRKVAMQSITLPSGREVFAGGLRQDNTTQRYFAEVVDRTVPCDVCHNARFIYVFDDSGTILGLTPLDLTKYNNVAWDDQDLCKMRSRVMGHNLGEPFAFDPKVDAVTSATITSAVVFDSLARGKLLMEELHTQGLM